MSHQPDRLPWIKSDLKMKTFEKVSTWLRHLPQLERADWLWDPVRPIYQRAVTHFGRNGLERVINGSDRILVSPRARGVREEYELGVWQALMAELKPGDTFVDVGAFIGLYTIGVGLRLQDSGRVIAFEPDIHNFALLQEHVRLNRLDRQVELHQAAVFDKEGKFQFLADGSSEARLIASNRPDTTIVDVVTLDSALKGKRIDILKIDVEGYEEMVLRGANGVLRTPSLKPRAIFIEVHPYAWAPLGTGSDSLLSILNDAGYLVESLNGVPIRSIEHYGEIIARRL
jgi:FkbM family methyltransferase